MKMSRSLCTVLVLCVVFIVKSDAQVLFKAVRPLGLAHPVINDNLLRLFPDERQPARPTKDEANAIGNHWALIVAGSSSWYNYRHQADACHAYQVLKRHGFSEDRIITMMYDDIAENQANPTPGIIINHPNGSDVYGGVKIDYRREDVTPSVFLSVLSGDKSAVSGMGTGRVIESGANDHVFVNFVDHGAPGILAFPADELHASELMATIRKMYKQQQYKQMVLYIEACESGSMFHHMLPKDLNVYATTAADPKESSYACYFDHARQTYLGDVYSVKWMEDSDKEKLDMETLHKQYEIVKQETNTSHVKQYGDRNISQEVVDQFQGGKEYVNPKPLVLPEVPYDAVPSESVRESILHSMLMKANTDQEKRQVLADIEEMIKERERIEMTTRHIVGLATKDTFQTSRVLTQRNDLVNIECYEPVARSFDEMCFDLSQHEFALRNMYRFVNLCQEGVVKEVIIDAIKKICQSHYV